MKPEEKFWDWVERKHVNQTKLFDRGLDELSAEIVSNVLELMDSEKISSAELARRLDTSRAHVTNTVKIGHNMTLRTVIKLLTVMGYRMTVKFEKIEKEEKHES